MDDGEICGYVPDLAVPGTGKSPADFDKYMAYAHKVEEALKRNGVSATVDDRSEKIGYKIREARLDRLPYMLIVGQKEEETSVVSVRSRFLGDEGQKPLQEFIDAVCQEIRTKEIRKIEIEEEKEKA